MTMWTRFMHADPRRDLALTTGSFLDDSHFYCVSDDLGQVVDVFACAWQRSHAFDAIVGLEANSRTLFFFSNSQQVGTLLLQNMSLLQEGLQLKSCNSFKLVGSTITTTGKPILQHRDQRVKMTIEKLRKLQFAPLRFDYRVRMAAAIFRSAVFGSEILELSAGLLESLRSGLVHMLWRGKTWCRCWATTATHIIPTHLLHPLAACFYHALTLASRLLQRREDLRILFVNNFEFNLPWCGHGPIAVIHSILQQIEAEWCSVFCFRSCEGLVLNLLEPNKSLFQHQLRQVLRDYVLRTNSAYLSSRYAGWSPTCLRD